MTTINLGKIKPLYKGAYTGGVTYRPLDFTIYFGNLYVCKAESTGNLPTDPAYFDPVTSINAAAVPNTPAGSISATSVQDAINELDAEKVAKTDVIAIAQGGTGATSANAAADAIGAFRLGTLLGTVSQSAGVPTGAVIERGSNVNGEYVRFADGTQICTGAVPTTFIAASVTTTAGVTYPAAFVGAYTLSGYGTPGGSADFYGTVWCTNTSTTSGAFVYRNGHMAQNIVSGRYMAVGRWF